MAGISMKRMTNALLLHLKIETRKHTLEQILINVKRERITEIEITAVKMLRAVLHPFGLYNRVSNKKIIGK